MLAMEPCFSETTPLRDSGERRMDLLLHRGTTAEKAATLLREMSAEHLTFAEDVAHLQGCLQSLRARSIACDCQVPGKLLDICGTGGDGKHTFNISTAAALLVASTGIAVAKHGNRAASGPCGSSDVCEALGIPLRETPEAASAMLSATGFTYLHAPYFQPALKGLADIRRRLAARTVFNRLGPLLNPAPITHMLLGTCDDPRLYAEILRHERRIEQAIVVRGSGGMDEFSLAGANYVAHMRKGSLRKFCIDAADFGLPSSDNAELIGADASTNAMILRDIFAGTLKGPKRNVVVMNAAAALVVAEAAATFREGTAIAESALNSGKALSLLKTIQGLQP